MKRVILFSILILLSASVFAATESFNFGIVWRHNVGATTEISILEYEGNEALENKNKDIDLIDTKQHVAMIRYTTNEGGLHTLSYKATPLISKDDSSYVGYVLYFQYGTEIAQLNIGDDRGTTYPSEANSVFTEILVDYGTTENTVADILVDAMLTALDDLKPDVTYQSTVIIERITT